MQSSQQQQDLKVQYDCYQYAFSSLLLFTSEPYFEDGYSNYNAVASFFKNHVPINMEEGVLFDRKNMLYDELYEYCINEKMLVVCCIEQHFTAFKVFSKERILYYDPLQTSLGLIEGENSCMEFMFFKLLKCQYADSQHILEHEDNYNGNKSNSTRRVLYKIWKNIHDTSLKHLRLSMSSAQLALNEYYFLNSKQNPSDMSTQLTGNTCYFQSYLFALLIKVGGASLSNRIVKISNINLLEEVSKKICIFLCNFFADQQGILRPYSNNNVILDFMRYQESKYYERAIQYLSKFNIQVDYPGQYQKLIANFKNRPIIQTFNRFYIEDKMPSVKNTKDLTLVCDVEDAVTKLCRYNYYRFRALNMMFGFHANIMKKANGFYEFNALRKNFLLSCYKQLKERTLINFNEISITKYREYYFHPQFEIGQKELTDTHLYTYLLDMISLMKQAPSDIKKGVTNFNESIVDNITFSTQSYSDYEKQMSLEKFQRSKEYYQFYLNNFLSLEYFRQFIPLGFNQINEKEKEKNALTLTVFYNVNLMQQQMYRQSFEFERECVNQMAKQNLTKYTRAVEENQDEQQIYSIEITVGRGHTYTKYNTILHFLGVLMEYWNNPDVNGVQVFGKDVSTIVNLVSQKITLSQHDFYHYGPLMDESKSYSTRWDMLLGSPAEGIVPLVNAKMRANYRSMLITDSVYGKDYLTGIVKTVLAAAKQNGSKMKSDDPVLNLGLLNLLLDLGLYDEYKHLLNIPMLYNNKEYLNKCQLQVKVANIISEYDKKNKEFIQTSHIQNIIWDSSHNFIVKKTFNTQCLTYKILNLMNSDPQLYQRLVLLSKIYMSLCQINKSVELEYYKIKYDGEYKIIIPSNFSKATGEYLEHITSEYNFYSHEDFLAHDKVSIFDMRSPQPEINLFKIRICSQPGIESMYRYIEIQNCFLGRDRQVISFVGGNLLRLQIDTQSMQEEQIISQKYMDSMSALLNRVKVSFTTSYVNKAVSMIPCFKFADNNDLIILTSKNFYYHVDTAGQFNDNYYGMKHELIENIILEQGFIDANDSHQFKEYSLDKLLVEFKTLLYYPQYNIQIGCKAQLISLIDYAIKIRNVSLFILLMFFLYRVTIVIKYQEKQGKIKKITGPWFQALLYVVKAQSINAHYNQIFQEQFFYINAYRDTPIDKFIDIICEQFAKMQKLNEEGNPMIIPTQKQKAFLKKLITGESFHFSEVGSGKSKVIVPLFCQMFLSDHSETHKYLSSQGKEPKLKTCLFLIVPEHLVLDAKQQVFRYCLNLNFREQYKIMDDVFNLLHENVKISDTMKNIYISSFTDFKKLLTFDLAARKIRLQQDRVLVLIDEVDDFLDREKLIFNICSNKANDFKQTEIQNYYLVTSCAYDKGEFPENEIKTKNMDYWKQLFFKCQQIHEDVLHKSKSINKSFGIFNEETLKHSCTNIAFDIEGYKSLIARPYESVNRAMPGSYYSDVERTIYLTYYILREDVAKYNNLFQSERKFITFDYYQQFIKHIDFDELIYGNTSLEHILDLHENAREGIIRYLYGIILSKMEVQDCSRSVNSIDVVLNFDCKGFTGTPFIDNYPTYTYVNSKSTDKIPDLIYREFYLHGNTPNLDQEWPKRFSQFQGDNNNVLVRYYESDFLQDQVDEEKILQKIFEQQGNENFNSIVDLCGIFKRLTILGLKRAIQNSPYTKRFKYIYHIDQTNLTDRIQYVHNENDVQYDEDFMARHTHHHQGAEFSRLIFFFIDNRNFKGKDIPFQIPFMKQNSSPLITTSIVIAHDVDDFSSIWQAMGRSRTMNQTKFIIYQHKLKDIQINSGSIQDQSEYKSMIDCSISKYLYVKNCDTKVTGNLSSIYQTLISLYNLSSKSYYYDNELVNIFLLKMDGSILKKLGAHFDKISKAILGETLQKNILKQILQDKLRISNRLNEYQIQLKSDLKSNDIQECLTVVISNIIKHKFELRIPSGDSVDELIRFLSGEQKDLHEYSYTKQQQKQKQTQANRNQDSDIIQNFKKEQQIELKLKSIDYFNATLPSNSDSKKPDLVKKILNHPILCKEIFQIKYNFQGILRNIRVFPTYQFLYSEFIVADYITKQVQSWMDDISNTNIQSILNKIFQDIQTSQMLKQQQIINSPKMDIEEQEIQLIDNFIRMNAQFTLAYLGNDIFIIGMKNQFTPFTLTNLEFKQYIKFISDDMGFITYNSTKHPTKTEEIQDSPYCLALYILLEKITKAELPQNVVQYYYKNYETLQKYVLQYQSKQGHGFMCWRFIMNQHQNKQILQQ